MPQIVRHFVTYIGSVPPNIIALDVYERKMLEVPDWNVANAVKVAGSVYMGNNSRPYAFYFTTRGRDKHELDSREIGRSPTYYLGGVLRTLAEVVNDPEMKNVADNMRQTKIDTVIVNRNAWLFVGAFDEKTDVLLNVTLPAPPLAKVD